VIEIRCSDDDARKNFGEKADATAGEYVFYFCFNFVGGKIFSIEHPQAMQKCREYLITNN
jgi:hypothetical protein